MDMEILISVEQVSRYYGDYCAVDNISFIIHRGEVLGFLGPNGAGKTTTMQMISGVIVANRGKISIAGMDIIDDAKSARSHIGFLPERPPLYLDLTVDEYLRYAAQLRRIAKPKINEAVTNSKQRCGLADIGNRLIRNLSKGYQQRVGIAQAIIHSPAAVILDEPTSGLDPIQIVEIRELIRELGKDHSVILSTHILPEVQTVCDRVLIIHEGRLVLDQHMENLHQERQSTVVTIAFRQPPSIDTLQSIDGIEKIDQVDEQRFRISYTPNSQALDKITQQASTSCWGLYEMIPQLNTLEDTFVRLTRGELDEAKQPITEDDS